MTAHFKTRMAGRFGIDLSDEDVRRVEHAIATGRAIVKGKDKDATRYLVAIKGVVVQVVVAKDGALVTALEPRTHNKKYNGRKQKPRASKHAKGRPVQRRQREEQWA